MTKAGTGWIARAVAILMAVALVAGVVVYALSKRRPPAVAPSIHARLELAAGQVWVEQGESAQPAVSGTALRAGAKIRTGKGARALVRLPDGSAAFLRAGSEITLADDAVTLAAGEYWLDVPAVDRQALGHRAGDAHLTAADAGLSLRRGDDGAVTVYVARGMAVLTAPGGRVEVHAGTQAVARGAEPPKVAPVAFWDDWTGGMADQGGLVRLGVGAGAIYGVDVGAPAGSAAQRLEIKRQLVRAVLRDGVSETEVDQTFFNPSERAVEGWYWFSVPERATVTGFAVETDGVLVEGEFIERREAAARYATAKATGHAPAILEWVDGRSYRARIYPVPAVGTRRVVLRYLELHPVVDGKLTYVYPMGQGEPVRIGELSLGVDLGSAGQRMRVATVADARIEDAGRRVTMRRSGFTPRTDFQLEIDLGRREAALELTRFEAGGESADYIMARYTPEVDWGKAGEARADVVLVVDTSAGGDEAARQIRTAAAEAVLRSLSADDRFALVALDVRPRVLHPDKELAPAVDAEIARALEKLAGEAPGGATDLASLFDAALGRVHGAEQPAVVYVGDGVATSGEMTGERLLERLRRALATSRARFFTLAAGAESDHGLLRELARAGGGAGRRVDDASDVTPQALELVAAVKVPTVTDLDLDLGAGLDEMLSSASGKISRGSEVVVLARTHHPLREQVRVRGRFAGQPLEQTVRVVPKSGAVRSLVPKLWAAEQVRRLLGAAGGIEAERGRITALGLEYGLVTPFTSILALESEVAYQRMNIPRRRTPLRGGRLSALDAREGPLVGAPAPLSFGCDRRMAGEPPPADNADHVTAAPAPVRQQAGEQAEAKAEAEPPAAASPAEARGRDGKGDDAESDALEGMREPGTLGRAVGGGAGRPYAAGAAGPRGEATAALPAAPAADAPPAAKPALAAKVAHGAPAKIGDKTLEERAKGKTTTTRREPQPTGWKAMPATCSDVARRPIAQRMVVWRKRLRTATGGAELVQRHIAALRACEIGDWAAERLFLHELQMHLRTAGDVETVLGHFTGRAEVQKFLARLILRRAVDAELVGAVERAIFGVEVRWADVDLELSGIADPDKRIALLRAELARAPEDPNGIIRLVRLLARAGHVEEALDHGRRLRDRGLLTVGIVRELGDVLARAGLEAEAVRTYSEIVEFDADNLDSRRLLGDVLLARSWYEPAYRQYLAATERAPKDALLWLRLAAAAAGTGRVDEALRIERQVASAEGRPGPADPRLWARLASAARLGRLLAAPPQGVDAGAIQRKLQELQLFRGPSVLVLVTWEDLGRELTLVTRVGDEDVALGEAVDAAPAGLGSALVPLADAERLVLMVRARNGVRDEPLALGRQEIRWDGKQMSVQVRKHELAAGASELAL
jgi:tetratricopeptide (TPR) repeat protein